MSSGPRLQLADAQRVSDALFRLWGMRSETCFVAGSVRRQRSVVGDLEIVAPYASADADPLYDVIAATMQRTEPVTLFRPPTSDRPPIGRAIRGLKPGFLSCSLLIKPFDHELPCQIYRYTPRNLGWILIMRTGPSDFGQWFLARWKYHWRIPLGDPKRQASVDGHLVDTHGEIVDVPTEHDAFKLCGLKFIDPTKRDAFIVQQLAAEKRW